jgi:hypothetical protein
VTWASARVQSVFNKRANKGGFNGGRANKQSIVPTNILKRLKILIISLKKNCLVEIKYFHDFVHLKHLQFVIYSHFSNKDSFIYF